MDPDIRKAFKTVDYLRMQVEFSTLSCDQEKKFMNELQATGVVIEPEVMKHENFQGYIHCIKCITLYIK